MLKIKIVLQQHRLKSTKQKLTVTLTFDLLTSKTLGVSLTSCATNIQSLKALGKICLSYRSTKIIERTDGNTEDVVTIGHPYFRGPKRTKTLNFKQTVHVCNREKNEKKERKKKDFIGLIQRLSHSNLTDLERFDFRSASIFFSHHVFF